MSPLDVLEHEHEWQGRLCDALERIADDLPDNVDLSLIHSVLPVLREDFSVHIRDEEEGLFPLLRQRVRKGDNFDEIAETLEREHDADRDYCDEIIDQLEDFCGIGRSRNPEMLGYMLRGFFESQRRHLAWENAVLLPLARTRLTADDLRELNRIMLENRRSRLSRARGAVLFSAVVIRR